MSRGRGAVLVGAVVLLVAGCSATSDGVASPASQDPGVSQSVSSSSSESQSPGGGRLPHSGAPVVSDPLPESAIPEDPCDAFTREQVEYALGDNAPEGKREELPTGPTCIWQDAESGAGWWSDRCGGGSVILFGGAIGGESLRRDGAFSVPFWLR